MHDRQKEDSVQTPTGGEDPVVRSDVDLDRQASSELLRLLFRHSGIVFLANLSASITLVIGLWSVAPAENLIVWFGLMLLFNSARWITGRTQASAPLEPRNLSRGDRLFLLSVLVSGLLWGSTLLLVDFAHHPTHSMFIALVLVAMVAASATLLSFHRLAYPVFALPVLVPLAVRLMTQDLTAHFAAGAVLPVYFVLLFLLSREIHRFTLAAVRERLLRERHALFDQLTGIPNRRAFEEFLEREWRRAIRTQTPVSLLIADIDDFKRCNDSFGHPAGDQVLRTVAALFSRATRRGGDLAARIGGEEFAVVAPATDQHGAMTMARNIQSALETLPQEVLASGLRPTLSIGICTMYPRDPADIQCLFRDADAALYESKAKGKNRITVHATARTKEAHSRISAFGDL
jgi:diguanylate cyclase (GGDEF)-like protein